MKPYIIGLLVPYLFYYFTGCSTFSYVGQEEFINEYSRYPVHVLTKSKNVYFFDAGLYTVKNDSIQGSGYQIYSEQMKIPFTGGIALNDVEIFNVQKTDGTKSILTFIGIVAGIFLLLYILAWISISNSGMDLFDMPN